MTQMMSRVMSRVGSRPQPRTVLMVLACVAACVAPLVLPDLTFFMRMVLAAIVVTGLSILMGYSGQASLGQGLRHVRGVRVEVSLYGCRRELLDQQRHST